MKKINIGLMIIFLIFFVGCSSKFTKDNEIPTKPQDNTNVNDNKPKKIQGLNEEFFSSFEDYLIKNNYQKEDNNDQSDNKFDLDARYVRSNKNINEVVMIKTAKKDIDLNNLEVYSESQIIETKDKNINMYVDQTPRFSILSILDKHNKKLIVMQILTNNKDAKNSLLEEYKKIFNDFIK